MLKDEITYELPMWPRDYCFSNSKVVLIDDDDMSAAIDSGFFECCPPSPEAEEYLTGLLVTKSTDFTIDSFFADISPETFKIIMTFYAHTIPQSVLESFILDCVDVLGTSGVT